MTKQEENRKRGFNSNIQIKNEKLQEYVNEVDKIVCQFDDLGGTLCDIIDNLFKLYKEDKTLTEYEKQIAIIVQGQMISLHEALGLIFKNINDERKMNFLSGQLKALHKFLDGGMDAKLNDLLKLMLGGDRQAPS